MSRARLRIWLKQALGSRLSAADTETTCDDFVRIASDDMGGERIYIPMSTAATVPLAILQTLRLEGKTWREIGEMFDISHESVRQRVNKPAL